MKLCKSILIRLSRLTFSLPFPYPLIKKGNVEKKSLPSLPFPYPAFSKKGKGYKSINARVFRLPYPPYLPYLKKTGGVTF